MNDIEELFSRITPTADTPPTTETVEADLARGRTARLRDHRQRTIRRSMLATTTIAAGVAAVLIATQLGGNGQAAHRGPTANAKHPSSAAPTGPAKHVNQTPAIKLVSYDGKQLQGFNVDRVPDGWHLSTSTQYALLIVPAGSHDNDPNAFEGKLAVLTSSVDEHGLGKGDDVTVNGQHGVVSDQGKYGLMLRYNDPDGFGVDIQAPADLAWTDQQIVKFAEGVHVTGNAVHSHG